MQKKKCGCPVQDSNPYHPQGPQSDVNLATSGMLPFTPPGATEGAPDKVPYIGHARLLWRDLHFTGKFGRGYVLQRDGLSQRSDHQSGLR